jgi:Leucine-rich repeat (LRR) protein
VIYGVVINFTGINFYIFKNSHRILILFAFTALASAGRTCEPDNGDRRTCSFRDITDSRQLYSFLADIPFNTDITKLYFQKATLTHLPKELTATYKELVELDASNVYLWRFTQIDFAEMTKFRKLNVSHNQIHRVESNACRGMASLENLDLSHNMINAIDYDGINYLEQLKFLNLSHNRIGKLDGNFFKNVRGVEILNLSHNRISSLTCESCGFETKTREFYLQHNQLLSFTPELIKSVLIFDISYNNIEGEVDFSSSRLTDLSIRGNSLQFLTINDDLQRLDASDNTERSFALSFGNNRALTSLALANLDIVHFEHILASLPQLDKLVNLDLSENNLESFDLAAHNLPQSLQTLNLKRTDLHSLVNWKSLQLPDLKEINIVDNFFGCSELPLVLAKFRELNVNVSGLAAAGSEQEFVKQNCAADSHRKRKQAAADGVSQSATGSNTLLWTFLIICVLGYVIGAALYFNDKYNFVGMIKNANIRQMTSSRRGNLFDETEEV